MADLSHAASSLPPQQTSGLCEMRTKQGLDALSAEDVDAMRDILAPPLSKEELKALAKMLNSDNYLWPGIRYEQELDFEITRIERYLRLSSSETRRLLGFAPDNEMPRSADYLRVRVLAHHNIRRR